jgi:hypothetical protein
MKLELLNLTNKAFRYYSKRVKGNEDITYDLARKKLTRNVILAAEIPPRHQSDVEKGNKLFHFGNLHILVKDGWVINVKNHRHTNNYTGWELDRFKFVELTIELGILD